MNSSKDPGECAVRAGRIALLAVGQLACELAVGQPACELAVGQQACERNDQMLLFRRLDSNQDKPTPKVGGLPITLRRIIGYTLLRNGVPSAAGTRIPVDPVLLLAQSPAFDLGQMSRQPIPAQPASVADVASGWGTR